MARDSTSRVPSITSSCALEVRHIEFSNIDRIKAAGLRYAPLHTRTKEGLGLHLQVSLQYRLIPQNLSALYSEFNQNYEQVFVSSVRDVLIKAASEYEAVSKELEFWIPELVIGEVIHQWPEWAVLTSSLATVISAEDESEEVSEYYEEWEEAAQLWEERDLFSQKMCLAQTLTVIDGQLMIIDLPDGFEHSIVQTQVQKQMMFIREQQQVSTKIRAETSVIKARGPPSKSQVLMADGHANYTVVTKEASATAERRKIDVESEALTIIKNSLHLSPQGLVLYQQYGALDDLEEASLMYGFGAQQTLLKPN
ncbi:unnamed protein product [Durusdinium trenchii]|uniref:Uncharacterized protein n=1 Tax=Durusdinium trenchii TaxID=1381693 RepID=A0ABP0T1T9_9DINO